MSPLRSSSIILALVCVVVFAACDQVSCNPVQQTAERNNNNNNNPEPIPWEAAADDSAMQGFLQGVECKEDEELSAGRIPECEPTCENPRPACAKIFYASLDFVPCFCKSPLVRNTHTKKCVSLEQCPK